MTAFFEDIQIGDRFELGSHSFTREEIVRFAEKFDPQPFHLSEEAAAQTHFGRLCASGWHTASVFMKLFVATQQALHRQALEEGRTPARIGPSPGFEDLKWIRPVFVGDTIAYTQVVAEKTNHRGRPDWGLVRSDMLGHNQDGTLVFSFRASQLIERLPA
ncbi:MaoC family dehydratase [Roseibium aggregatum]|uniref:MaoC family dehydratase n=1 Tax=Roseibium aggregatum TaxID=187304 RepID=A0A939J6E4_9HYPH|nr:MaoC family dehydratase [Roseibium aggregatum]MBN9673647.1 MaoC family dehydratase [Roseibium aggregatum]